MVWHVHTDWRPPTVRARGPLRPGQLSRRVQTLPGRHPRLRGVLGAGPCDLSLDGRHSRESAPLMGLRAPSRGRTDGAGTWALRAAGQRRPWSPPVSQGPARAARREGPALPSLRPSVHPSRRPSVRPRRGSGRGLLRAVGYSCRSPGRPGALSFSLPTKARKEGEGPCGRTRWHACLAHGDSPPLCGSARSLRTLQLLSCASVVAGSPVHQPARSASPFCHLCSSAVHVACGPAAESH